MIFKSLYYLTLLTEKNGAKWIIASHISRQVKFQCLTNHIHILKCSKY